MLWQANKSGKTTVAVTRDLLLSTSAQFSSSSREALSFGAEFVRDNTLSVTEQLGFIAQPLIRGWEVEDTRFLVEEEGADEVTFSLDAAHWTAFRGQGATSSPLFFSSSHVSSRAALGKSPIPLELSTSAASLRQFSDAFITRANAVVVGVGVEHASFAAAAERVLAGLPAGRKAESPAARYVGGETHTESPEQPTVVLGFESAAFGSSGFFAAGVLHQVLGRTPDRFLTKARPGHGLASRLNRKLGGQGAVIFADSFATGYSDTGLFGVVFKTLSGDENAVTQAVVAELLALAEKPLDAAELEGAKRRLKVMVPRTRRTSSSSSHVVSPNSMPFWPPRNAPTRAHPSTRSRRSPRARCLTARPLRARWTV